jgi:hypothetical protein
MLFVSHNILSRYIYVYNVSFMTANIYYKVLLTTCASVFLWLSDVSVQRALKV